MYSVKKLKLNPNRQQVVDRLKQPPKELFIKGAFDQSKPVLAVVGTRKPSSYGRQIIRQLIAGLKGREVTILSGLAIGIDTTAHQVALANNLKTIAILPCGIKTIYPKTNQTLANKILSSGGGLISEQDNINLPKKYTFVLRNRLIASMCDAVLIPEAATNSGSLYTARFASELGIPVAVVPGPIISPVSQGTNQLLRTIATPINYNQDILDLLQLNLKHKKQLNFEQPLEKQIFRILHQAPLSSNNLAEILNQSIESILPTLTSLEMANIIYLNGDEWSLNLTNNIDH